MALFPLSPQLAPSFHSSLSLNELNTAPQRPPPHPPTHHHSPSDILTPPGYSVPVDINASLVCMVSASSQGNVLFTALAPASGIGPGREQPVTNVDGMDKRMRSASLITRNSSCSAVL